MGYTSFEQLEQSIIRLGAKPVVANLNKELLGSGLDMVHPDQVVIGDGGVYVIDPAGVVAKVILYIVDKKIDDKYSLGLDTLVKNEDFDNEELIKASHKFHLLKCLTIERAESDGWGEKYKMSRRVSGDFFYRFIKGNKVYKVNEHQILQPCMNCIKKINSFPDAEFDFSRSSFNLNAYFDHASYRPRALNKTALACESVPSIYQSDWSKISTCYRKLKNYKCESEGCPAPDLSKNKQFLHVHHVNMDKSNSGYSNLIALCLYCHANQPNHGHMKSTPDYKSYLSIVGVP
jgi:hypothetical protein